MLEQSSILSQILQAFNLNNLHITLDLVNMSIFVEISLFSAVRLLQKSM